MKDPVDLSQGLLKWDMTVAGLESLVGGLQGTLDESR